MVNRFDIEPYEGTMDLESNGEYVLYSDYAILQQVNKQLKEALRKCSPLMWDLDDKDYCFFCGASVDDLDHKDDCEWVKLTQESEGEG